MEEPDEAKSSKKLRFKETIKNIRNSVTVEPVILCFGLSYWMSALTIQNLSLEKACLVNLNIDPSICMAMQQRNLTGYNVTDETVIQKVVASAYVWKNVIHSVLPSILLPLFGSWSDRHKTVKVLLLMPILGEVITNLTLIVCVFFFYELPMEVNIVAEVLPMAVTGGVNMLLLGIFTYVTTVCTMENRTFRIGVIHILWMMCITIGNALSGVLYKLIGFYGVFTLALIMHIAAGLYAYFIVDDILADKQKQLTKFQYAKDVLNIKQTLNNFNFLVAPNRGDQLKQITVVMSLAVLVLGPFVGEATVRYLYTRLRLGWGEVDYSIFVTYSCVIGFIGNFVAISIFKWLKLDDGLLGALSSVSKICGGIVYALSTSTLMFYIAALGELFSGTAFVASRSIMTKLVEETDLCKVNALFGIAESLTNLICGPMYSAVYKATINSFPGSIFVLGICITIPAVLLYVWLYSKRTKRLRK